MAQLPFREVIEHLMADLITRIRAASTETSHPSVRRSRVDRMK